MTCASPPWTSRSHPPLDVPPRSRVQVICQVKNVSASAKLGHFVGLIEARGLTGVQLLVSLDVV